MSRICRPLPGLEVDELSDEFWISTISLKGDVTATVCLPYELLPELIHELRRIVDCRDENEESE